MKHVWILSAFLAATGCGDDGGGDDGDSPNPPSFRCDQPIDGDSLFHVAVDGDDEGGDGSEEAPWATIDHALSEVSDGATILVGPGTYEGRVRLDEQFATGVTVRAEPMYGAKLRHDETVVTAFYGQGITLSGFDISHSGDGAGPLLIQIQDLIDGAEAVSRITIRNNILHDSYNNDIIKLNNGARDVLIERNVFYNQQGSDEHIDINSVSDVVVQDNVFFNDFEASGRSNDADTSAFIVIKDSNGSDDEFEGSERIVIRRNVMMSWQGGAGANMLLIGEDGNSYHEARDVLIENNLMVGNGTDEIRAPFGIKGARDVVFRHNTLVGDFPGSAFAFRFNQEGDNPTNQNVEIYNNIFSDPTGSMGDFSDTPSGETEGFTLSNNLFWNGGSAIPSDDDLITRDSDSEGVDGDPGITFGSLTMPTWNESSSQFRDGSGDACAVHEAAVRAFGVPSASGAAKGSARGDESPETDILGRNRSASADIGAVLAE